jgi:hypothetical protein
MSITNQDVLDCGLLVDLAERMSVPFSSEPREEPGIAAAGWDVIGRLIAKDSILPDPASLPSGLLGTIQTGIPVFFGYLARNRADPSKFAVAIRGTNGFLEWIINTYVPLIAADTESRARGGAKVELGFRSIYKSMELVGWDGVQTAADGIVKAVGKGTVTVSGHSLGAALATFLSKDVAKQIGTRARACLFASPLTGDPAWAKDYQDTVSDYRLINYVLDIVPYVPPEIEYQTLPHPEILQPDTARAEVKFDLGCNHNLISYCAMIDYEGTTKRWADAKEWPCIAAPPGFGFPNRQVTRNLALMAQVFGGKGNAVVRAILEMAGVLQD